MAFTAIVAGGSGPVGRNLINLLLSDRNYGNVISLNRREISLVHPKLTQVVVDFRLNEKVKVPLTGDVFFYCTGTTKAKTRNKKEYENVEYQLPVKVAKLALENGIGQFHFVSSLGAATDSSNIYLQCKGKAEEALQTLNFTSSHFYRPSLLKGHREELRLLEKVAGILIQFVNPFLTGKLKKYRSISAETVAKAMLNRSLESVTGVHIYESDQISNLV